MLLKNRSKALEVFQITLHLGLAQEIMSPLGCESVNMNSLATLANSRKKRGECETRSLMSGQVFQLKPKKTNSAYISGDCAVKLWNS